MAETIVTRTLDDSSTWEALRHSLASAELREATSDFFLQGHIELGFNFLAEMKRRGEGELEGYLGRLIISRNFQVIRQIITHNMEIFNLRQLMAIAYICCSQGNEFELGMMVFDKFKKESIIESLELARNLIPIARKEGRAIEAAFLHMWLKINGSALPMSSAEKLAA